ncbi:hypothetical protein GYB22_05695 [bacterium]|nr:hypothetical protein [bacterium]
MNYLSHFYFDRVDDNKYYNLGLILPDLARAHIPKLRINPYRNIEFTTEEIGSINRGCNRHFASDRKFHNWSTFVKLSQEAIDSIRESGDKDLDRDYFISHILVEILLDKILLDKNPSLADEFYAMIDSIEMDWILKYLRYSGLQDDELFKGNHRRFMKAAFLKKYTSIENAIDMLEKVAIRASLKEFTEGQKELLTEISEAIEPQLERSLGELEIQLL